MSLGPSASNPLAFNSFTDWWCAGLALQTVPELPEPRVIPWNLPPKLMTDGLSTAGTHRVESATWVNEVLTLSAPTSSTPHAPPHHIDACRDIEENPLGLNSLQSNLLPPSLIMAFQRADLW